MDSSATDSSVADSFAADPVRRILHCDMDSFYASVHQRDDPELRGKPVVVGGRPESRGVVAAASYEARKFGVRSAMPSARAHRLCPQAIFLPADFPRYRKVSAEVVAIFREFTPVVQVVSIDEAYLDVTEVLEPWGSATAIAQAIRARVKEELQLTVSIGIGPNKLIAKIASDADKPDGLTVVKPERVQAFLDPLPVRSLRGVGPATEGKLIDLGLRTVRDVRLARRDELETRFGKFGTQLHRFAHGEDKRSVATVRRRKSVSCERTFAEDVVEVEEMLEHLDRMASQVADGLAKREFLARTVTIKVRYPDFETVTRSRTSAMPTAEAAFVAQVARQLLDRTEAAERGVRLLGVGAAGLVSGEDADSPQLSIFTSSAT